MSVLACIHSLISLHAGYICPEHHCRDCSTVPMMNSGKFTFLFLAKKVLVLFTGEKIIGFYLDKSGKVFDVKPEWYILALDANEKSKWN